MEKPKRKAKSRYLEPPKHLALAKDFDFVFPLPMHEYADRLKAVFGEKDVYLSLDDGGTMTFHVSKHQFRFGRGLADRYSQRN